MSRAENKEKYKKYDHNYYLKHKRPKSKIGQAEQKISNLEAKLAESKESCRLLEGLRKSEAEKKDIAMKRVSELKQQLAEKNQDKISFAVAELGKAKIEFETYYADNIWNYPQYLEDRIAELTHQHEDKGETK